MTAATAFAVGGGALATVAHAGALSKAQRDAMKPDEILQAMKAGNQRFRAGQRQDRDFLAQQKKTAKGQYPAAVLLSCIDSRAPAETIMDLGIGDIFNSRVAGNIANEDILGSMEFACKLAGAKVVLVMGHTACGAIKGAIANAGTCRQGIKLAAAARPAGGRCARSARTSARCWTTNPAASTSCGTCARSWPAAAARTSCRPQRRAGRSSA